MTPQKASLCERAAAEWSSHEPHSVTHFSKTAVSPTREGDLREFRAYRARGAQKNGRDMPHLYGPQSLEEGGKNGNPTPGGLSGKTVFVVFLDDVWVA